MFHHNDNVAEKDEIRCGNLNKIGFNENFEYHKSLFLHLFMVECEIRV